MENSDSILEKVVLGLKERRRLEYALDRGRVRTRIFMRIFCQNCRDKENCIVYDDWDNPYKYIGVRHISPRFSSERCYRGLSDWYFSNMDRVDAELDRVDSLMNELEHRLTPWERRMFLCSRCAYGKSLEDSGDCARDSNSKCIVGLWDILMSDADASFDSGEDNE